MTRFVDHNSPLKAIRTGDRKPRGLTLGILVLFLNLLLIGENVWAGPFILSGQAPDATVSRAPVYAELFDDLWFNSTNGGNSILVLGADASSAAGQWVQSVATEMTAASPTVLFATGSSISTVSFSNVRLLVIPSDSANAASGLDAADYIRINSRKSDIAEFLFDQGALFGLTPGQTESGALSSGSRGFTYLSAALGDPTGFGPIEIASTPPDGRLPSGQLFDNVDATIAGVALGLPNTNLDDPTWRNVFTTFPSSFETLMTANEPGDLGFDGVAAMVRGEAVRSVPIPSTLLFFGLGFAGFAMWRKRIEKIETN